jgi:hypothetical protein
MSSEQEEGDKNSTGDTVISVLTGELGVSIESAVIYEDTKMAEDPRLEKAFSLIREVIAEERARTISDMLKGANAAPSLLLSYPAEGNSGMSQKSQRAPAGSARVLCERTLEEAKAGGLTVMRIHELAANEYERMLSISAIRNELAGGEKMKPPRYRQIGGVWYLAKHAPVM